MEPTRPSHRSITGMLILIFGLSAYAFGVAAVGELIIDWSIAIQSIYYLIFGIIWIWPVKWLLKWMAAAYKDSEE